MAFWGIEVKPGKPFTHTYDSSKGRLHISQATLGLGTTDNKSIVQCNVGNSSPVFLCSLFPEKTESLQLHIEFEEGEEVIFSVIGPRSVHLTGHYVGTGRHFTANDESESYGEDIADTETERSDRSAEDTYEDSFIDDSDPINPLSSPVSEDGVEAFSKKKPKKVKSKSRRLRKKYQLSESDDENHLQQDSKVNEKANVTPEVESGDEDFFTLTSLCKPKASLKSTNIEAKDKVAKKANETDYKTEDEPVLKSTCLEVKDKVGKRASETDCKIEDADGSCNDLEREIGCMVAEDEAKRSTSMLNVLPCNTLVPSTEIEQENGTVSKKKKKEKRKKQTTKETDGANSTNNLQEDQGPQDEPNVEKMHPILPVRNEQKEAASTQEADQLDNTFLPAAEADLGNVAKSKKKKKHRKENITLNVDGNHSNAVEEAGEQIQQGDNEKADASLNLPLASEVGSENGAKRKKKRKERSKEQVTPEADNTQHNSVIKEDNNKPGKTISDKMGEEFSVNEHADVRSSERAVEQLATENKPKKKKKTKVVESEEILSTDKKYC